MRRRSREFPRSRFSARFRSGPRPFESRTAAGLFSSRARARAFLQISQTATGCASAMSLRVQALFSTVQYSFSKDSKNMVETLVFHVREPKDLMQLSIEDSASAVTSPADMLDSDTPASRISSWSASANRRSCWPVAPASADGPAPDQSAYEPLFRAATASPGQLPRPAAGAPPGAGRTGSGLADDAKATRRNRGIRTAAIVKAEKLIAAPETVIPAIDHMGRLRRNPRSAI